MSPFVLTVFCLVYLGMILGRLPGLALDRTGIAILGAIALVAGGALTPRPGHGRRGRAHHGPALRADGRLGPVPPGRLLTPWWPGAWPGRG